MAAQILYVHHRAQVSGAARSLAALISRLGSDWSATVLTPHGPVIDLFAAAGANVRTAPAALFQHTWDNPYAGRKWLLLGRESAALGPHLRALGRLLREEQFALVHLNDSPLVASAALAKRKGLPVVWHLRSALSHRGRVLPHVVRAGIERWGDEAIAIDADVRDSFELRIPTSVIFNSVSVPAGTPTPAVARHRLDLPTDRLLVGFVGNLRRIKGWPELVEAAAMLRDERVHWVIVGGGVRPAAFFGSPYGRFTRAAGLTFDDEADLRAAIRDRGLESRFSMLPFIDEMAEVYPALDVVVFPNQGVGLGRPVLEAAAFERVAVASGSDTGAGILIPGETGLLLARGTPEAIADAVRTLLHDPALRERLAAAAAAHARTAFDAGAAAAAVRDVYGRVASTGR